MSQQREEAAITVFADYVCPFCYLGRESLRRYQDTREEELQVDWHPFDLRSQQRDENGEIDHDVDDGKDEDYYSQARENVKRLQEKYDVEMVDELVTDVDSLDAQMVSYYVKEHYPYETWAEFDESVYDALWKAGRDIGDADVLAGLAEETGIDPDEVRSAIGDDTLRSEVEGQFREAHQQGVTGVPTFAYDGHAARGAVPPEQLKRLVEGA
jgi:predicted DsbA family dithiol-disulfide isomerase